MHNLKYFNINFSYIIAYLRVIYYNINTLYDNIYNKHKLDEEIAIYFNIFRYFEISASLNRWFVAFSCTVSAVNFLIIHDIMKYRLR